MADALLSDAWLDAALGVFGGVAIGDPARLVVEYRAEHAVGLSVHHQVFDGGRLVGWPAGPAPEAADLCLRQPLDVQLAMLTRTELGNGLLAATTVIDPGTGEERPPPPLDDIADETWGRGLPVVSTAAAFTVESTLTGSPFGTVTTHYRFEQGRLATAGLGTVGSPDVTSRRTYRAALEERAGQLDLLDSFAGGGVDGDFRKLPLLLGIYDSDQMRDERRRLTGPCEPALIRLGEILSLPAWGEAAKSLPEAGGGADAAMRSFP